MHSSCSRPLISGERFGSLQLEGLVTEDDEFCNVVPPPPCEDCGNDGEDCCDKLEEKPAILSFTFLGGGCAADSNSQDDSDCDGGVGTPASVTIQVIDKKDVELFNGTVALGETFSFGDPGEKLNPNIFIYIKW